MLITVNASGVSINLMPIAANAWIWCQILQMHQDLLQIWCRLQYMHQDLSIKLMSITANASRSFYEIGVNYCECTRILYACDVNYCKCIRIFYEFDVNFCECGRILYEIWFYVIVLKNFCVLNIPRIVISWITQNASGSWMNFDVMWFSLRVSASLNIPCQSTQVGTIQG
jgi:hypothetical protein